MIVVVFYGIYSLVRNLFGSALVSGSQVPVEAFINAVRVIRIERALGSYHEETIQEWFLPHENVIKFFATLKMVKRKYWWPQMLPNEALILRQ